MNNSIERCFSWLPAICLLAAAVTSAQGCGSGEYNRRLEQRVSTLGQESAFAQLGNMTQIPGSPFFVSLPPGFEPLHEGLDPKRVRIPFADFPERKVTYEAFVADAAQGKQHYYCYLATVPVGAVGGTDPVQGVINRARNVFGNIGPPETVNVATPTGQMVPWQKYRVSGKQVFRYTDAAGQERFPEMDGLLEIWSRKVDEAGAFVAIGWRVPTVNGRDFVELDKKAMLVAGSLIVKK